jgi:uncharacterized protein YciW
LAVLEGDNESLAPRGRALAQLATTLTAQPWALTTQAVEEVSSQGLDGEQIEAAIVVISMFNYFTRVADATGIEFDYQTPLPAFEPDLRQATALRPSRSVSRDEGAGRVRRRLRQPQLRAAWESWRSYVLDCDAPITRRERRVLAAIAAEETADWEGAEALSELSRREDGDEELIGFARKLSRQPWQMEAADLARLRAAGHSEQALLHVISVVAHQNADSRLVAGLSSAGSA